MAEKPSSEKNKGGDNKKDVVYSYYNTQLLSDRLKRRNDRAIAEKFDPRKHKDTKRSHIALVFVYGYMITTLLIIIFVPLYNASNIADPQPLDLERILSQIGALIGAPLGFVIGYYFKDDK